MSATFKNIYHPGQGFFAGIYEFSRGATSYQNTFLQNIGTNTKPRFTTEIEFAIENGKVAVADECGYGGNGFLVTEDKFKREVYTFPLFNEVMRITGHELLNRPPTKSANDSWSSEEAQAYWVARKLRILHARIQMARECMMAQMLVDGNLKFSNTQNIKLNRKTTLTKSITAKWNVAAGIHDPIKDIAEMCILVRKESGIKPKGILMDGNTYEQMRSAKKFIEVASFTFSDIHLGDKSNQENGAVLMGTLMAGGCMLDVWVYDGSYQDSDGKKKDFIPEGKVIVGDFNAQNDRVKWYFGATDALHSHINLAKNLGIPSEEAMEDISDGRVVPTHWVDRNCLEIGLQSAMVCLPSDINMFGIMTVK